MKCPQFIKAIEANLNTLIIYDDNRTKAQGRITHKLTIECSECGAEVPKTLADRWHNCQCGASYNRDHNAARNIKHRAVGHRVL